MGGVGVEINRIKAIFSSAGVAYWIGTELGNIRNEGDKTKMKMASLEVISFLKNKITEKIQIVPQLHLLPF